MLPYNFGPPGMPYLWGVISPVLSRRFCGDSSEKWTVQFSNDDFSTILHLTQPNFYGVQGKVFAACYTGRSWAFGYLLRGGAP